MINAQIMKALGDSEQHWSTNEYEFARLAFMSSRLWSSSQEATIREQASWFDRECQADKCALCRIYHYDIDIYIIGECPLDDDPYGTCCVEWRALRDACANGVATVELVHAVTARIQLESSKLRRLCL